MNPIKTCAALAPALMLLACGQAQLVPEQPGPTPVASPATETHAGTEAAVAPGPAPAVVTNGGGDGKPDLTPSPLPPEAERGEKGARNVLLAFARAIELGEYGQARAMLSDADKAKWSKAAFARMFADLSKVSVAIPGGTIEGAAGSSYYTAPVAVTGADRDGRPVRIQGEAVLQRVNDVDGATPAQLRWHFERLTLEWTH